MSSLKVCRNVQLNNKYEHTIFFTDHNERDAYFNSKVVATFENLSYLRKKWNIKVQALYASARSWNYAFTEDGSHPRYYYFITEVNYISDTTVELVLELDVMITYIHMYTINKSFVERNHVIDDTIGKHTVEESIDIGEIVTYADVSVPLNSLAVVILSSVHPTQLDSDGKPLKEFGQIVGGVFSGLCLYGVQLSDYQILGTWLDEMSKNGTIDNIVTMWMYPKNLLHINGEWGDTPFVDVLGVEPLEVNYHRTNTNGDYTPRNNKLLTYPFKFMYLTNNAGNACTYRYERFTNPASINFKLTGAVSPSDSVRMYPKNYNGEADAYESGLTLGTYPTCAWSSDTYKLWLAQNQNQNNLAYATAGLTIAGGLVTTVSTGGIGGVAGIGAMVAGASQIASLLAQNKDREIQPKQSKGSYSGSINIMAGFQTFTLKHKGVSTEFAKIIDDYFDMYGYRLNRLMLPRIHARENWSYVKTIGANVSGNIPNDDLDKIKSIYDNGITFWVNGDEIGNYALPNNPI